MSLFAPVKIRDQLTAWFREVGNRWQFTRGPIALFGVEQEVFLGELRGRLSVESLELGEGASDGCLHYTCSTALKGWACPVFMSLCCCSCQGSREARN